MASDDTPKHNEIIAMALERKTRREALADRMKSAANTLRPSALAARITDEQKAKMRATAKKVGDVANEHKVAIGAAAAVTVAAGVAGAIYLNSRKKTADAVTEPDAPVPADGAATNTVATTTPETDAPSARNTDSSPA